MGAMLSQAEPSKQQLTMLDAMDKADTQNWPPPVPADMLPQVEPLRRRKRRSEESPNG